jgi:hypothetical protein
MGWRLGTSTLSLTVLHWPAMNCNWLASAESHRLFGKVLILSIRMWTEQLTTVWSAKWIVSEAAASLRRCRPSRWRDSCTRVCQQHAPPPNSSYLHDLPQFDHGHHCNHSFAKFTAGARHLQNGPMKINAHTGDNTERRLLAIRAVLRKQQTYKAPEQNYFTTLLNRS